MAGAGSSSSSLTSTTNTLTFAPQMAVASAPSAVDMLALLAALSADKRRQIVPPSDGTPTAALHLSKQALDDIAPRISDYQLQSLKEANKKRKRGESLAAGRDVLKVRRVHVDGFETAPIWHQANRIVKSTLSQSLEALAELREQNLVVGNDTTANPQILEFDEEGFEVGSSNDDSVTSGEDMDEEEVEDDTGSGLDSTDNDLEGLDEEDYYEGEELDDQDEEEDQGINGQEQTSDAAEEDEVENEPEAEFEEDPDKLNDGFFSIDNFNKQTLWFEEQDAKGDPNTDQASDDEDIDWNADPLAVDSVKATARRPTKSGETVDRDEFGLDEGDEDDDDDDDGGPTFGHIDLNAPEGASEDEDMEEGADEGEEMNANEIYYADFFAPPPRKAKAGHSKKAVRFEAQPAPGDEDVERAMRKVKVDLFEDLSDHEGSEDALSDVSAGDVKSRRSTHERRLAKIADEIRKLEKASVEKKAWTLSGEAAAADRPVNSLLEEDLDFEHVGKPVPVITAEISEDIESMIKRRIVAQQFDEVIRRRPDVDGGVPAGTRRGLVEVDDSKAEKSLAELYEEEHVRKTNPDSYVSKADETLRREEKAIEAMWRDVCGKLDALSSWHYKPRPAAAALTVVADAAAISMEDAQPATAQGVAGGVASGLAPQEVYKPGADTAERGEVVARRSGLPVARGEMSREEKTRRRRRDKERIRKAGGLPGDKNGATAEGTRAKERIDTMTQLKKGGVKVINRKGEIVTVEGKKAKAEKAVSAGSYKL